MRPTDKGRLLRKLSGARRDETRRTVLHAIQSREALGSTGVGQGVALLALARTSLAVWDLISRRIVRSFDLS